MVMNELNTDYKSAIIQLLDERDLSLKDFANSIGMTRKCFVVMLGYNRPTISTLNRIADGLNISVSVIVLLAEKIGVNRAKAVKANEVV